MVKRIPPMLAVTFLLLATSGVWCQKYPSNELRQKLQFNSSNSVLVQRQEMRTRSSFPDAPSSAQRPTEAVKFRTFVNKTGSPLTPGAFRVSAGAMPGTEPGHVTRGPQPNFTDDYKVVFSQEESRGFLDKYLYPSLLKQDARYYASTSDSFMGRASYAASRILVTRDDSGKGRLNTQYLFRLLTQVASTAAYRPSWARSTSSTLNNFGSTIGSDAGMKVYQEFGPGIRQMVKGFTPKFVSRIEERINHDRSAR